MAVTKTETVAAKPQAVEHVELKLAAHKRYWYKGVVFEHQNKYKVTPEQATDLLSQRTDSGAPVFVRATAIKPKPVPVEEQGPKTVDMSKSTLIAGMSDATVRKAFNVTTPEEDSVLEQELAARAEQEQQLDAGENGDGEGVEV